MGWVVTVTTRPPLPRERTRTPCTVGWVGPTAGQDGCGKSRLPSGFYPRTAQPVAQSLSRPFENINMGYLLKTVPPAIQPAIQRPHSLILLGLHSYQNGLLSVICGNIPTQCLRQHHTHTHTHTHRITLLKLLVRCFASSRGSLQTVRNMSITCQKYLYTRADGEY
jgi:hypothetical protein